MKKLKFTLFSIAMAFMVFTSCSNNEPIVEEQQNTEESASITASLNRLSVQFDQNGNLTADSNPAGNVVFDFCFDFVYPLDLSYNNGVTVTVADLDGLIEVMISSTEDLYISGIAFPFDVETYNDSTNAIEIVTINTEEEFASLLEDCSFDDFETCECFEDYNPVCVEITDPNGETFTITYPNACYAECDGFTEDDFAENCEEDYYSSGSECFTLNFPLSILVNDVSVTVNSEEELGTVLYDAYNFDFVYPFTVTLDNEEIETINSPDDIEALIEDCYGEYNGNDDCVECENLPVEPVCIEYNDDQGNTIVTVFPNMCFAECAGFTQNNVVECEDDTNPQDCTEDSISAIIVECPIIAIYTSGTFGYIFSTDGTFEVINGQGSTLTSGSWIITEGNNGYINVVLDAISGNFDDEWSFINCDWDDLVIQSLNEESASIGTACD